MRTGEVGHALVCIPYVSVAGVVARVEDRVAEHLVRLEGVISCAKGVDPVAGVVVGGIAAERVAAVALPSRVHVGGPRTPTAGCGGIDPCTPGICERLSTPSDESYACIMLRRSITLKTAVVVTLNCAFYGVRD